MKHATAALRPIRPQSLDKTVLEALIVMIEQANLTIGDRLPPEQELAARLGVGRSTIREALKAWQSMGIVTRNKGAGTTLAAEVTSNSVHVPITLKLEAESLIRTNEVRLPLEVEAIRFATVKASNAQRDLIAERVETLLEVHARGDDWRAVDAEFHAAIHAACGNPLFGQLSRQILDVFLNIYRDPLGVPLLGESSIPLHRGLSNAIIIGDVTSAVQHMLEISRIVEAETRRHIADA